jgi:hypothetical protein
LKQGLWQLAAIGWTAPLVGALITALIVQNDLLGTYTSDASMGYTFFSAATMGMCGVMFGLIASVPAIWGHRWLKSRADRLLLEMDLLSFAIIRRIDTQLARHGGRANAGCREQLSRARVRNMRSGSGPEKRIVFDTTDGGDGVLLACKTGLANSNLPPKTRNLVNLSY